MNKLLQYMIGAGNVSDKFLPHLAKAQKGYTALPIYQSKGQVKEVLNNLNNLNRYDSFQSPSAIRANAEKQLEFKKMQAAKNLQERRGTIRQAAAPRSTISKAIAVAANPLTALSYKVKGLDIPENFDKGSRNPIDYALDIVNPFGYAEAASSIPGNIARGELVSAGINAATMLPMMSEFRGLRNVIKSPVANAMSSSVSPRMNLEELRRVYHNSERFLQPEESRFLHKAGYGKRDAYRTSSSLWNRQDELTDDQLNKLADITNNNDNPFGWGTPNWRPGIRVSDDMSQSVFRPRRGSQQLNLFNENRAQASIPVTLNNIDIRRPINGNAPGTPEWNRLNDEFLSMRLNQSLNSPRAVTNKSGLTKEEIISRDTLKDKDSISKMSEKEFQESIFKPTGEVSPYYQGSIQDQFTGNNAIYGMTDDDYVNAFNERLDLLNDIISQNNKSGIDYSVKGLDNSGRLTFHTPGGQRVRNTENRSIRDFLNTDIREIPSFFRNEIEVPKGDSYWNVNIKPGQWRGEVKDIPSADYFKSIPGLEMSNTTRGVFSDAVPRRGTGTYESINEYLKRLDLGRVKPGFNSQTESSRGLWENAVQKDKAFGYYAHPRTIYGSMKAIAPIAIPTGIGAAALNEQRYGGQRMQQGGPILDPRGQWAYPGQVTRIPSPNITMQGVPYPVFGVGSNGQQQMMYPGQDYDFNDAQYVDEYPMMRNGGGLLSKSVTCSNCGWSWKAVDGGHDPLNCHKCGGTIKMKNGGQHGGLDRWFAEKWVDVKTGKACGRQEGESRKGYPACRPSKRVSSQTPKTSSEMSSAEKAKFKRTKTSSERIPYNHKK